MSEERQALLSTWFDDAQIDAIHAYEVRFGEAETLEDIEAVFEEASRLGGEVINPPDSLGEYEAMEYYNGFAGSELGIPGLYASCVAECTEATFSADLESFQAAASKTESFVDDAFFRIVAEYSWSPDFYGGDFTGYGRIFQQTWDYGGYSLLGEGRHEALITSIDSLASESEAFDRFLQSIRQNVVGDIIGTPGCFALPSDQVRAELSRIGMLESLSADEKALISERMDQLNAGHEQVETDCQNQPCSCSG